MLTSAGALIAPDCAEFYFLVMNKYFSQLTASEQSKANHNQSNIDQ